MMTRPGNIRLQTAFIGTIILHAGFLWLLAGTPITSTNGSGRLLVELLETQLHTDEVFRKEPARTLSKNIATEEKEPPHKAKVKSAPKSVELAIGISRAKSAPRAVEISKPEKNEDQSTVRSQSQEASGDVYANRLMASVPENVQGMILTHVRYPWMARKRGWEGEVALRLDVRAQQVMQVTMLVSSGYNMLDDAAHKGVVSVERLPLSDGFYRLPVRFRLQ